ncbi:hypothetical protein F5Y17DRAFT_440069 [Xylariaceae sp. FL0594]|nr:hypothetical protein F5Y17DRAFT_440069 [Xylariaceae sp. FL0594]
MPEYPEKAANTIAAGVGLSILAVLTVALRFWTRRVQKQPLKVDDWLLLPAVILNTATGIVLTYAAVHRALGWPLQIPPDYRGDVKLLQSEQLTLARKAQWVIYLFFPLALGTTKASLLFLYKRIFSISKRTHYLLISTIAIVGLWTVLFFFLELFQCSTKFWALWTSTQSIQTECMQTSKKSIGLCVTDFAIDMVVIAIPIYLVWPLRLSAQKKAAVLAIFFLGVITVVASLVRMIVAIRVEFSPDEATAEHRFTGLAKALYWAMVETSVGISVASLSTIQYLFWKDRWRALFGRAILDDDDDIPRVASSEHLRSSNLTRPAIQVEFTVDVVYSSKDSNPILENDLPWENNDRSEEGSNDAELHDYAMEEIRRGTQLGTFQS